MEKQSKNKGLIFSIIFAAIVLSGSLIFFGYITSNAANPEDLSAEIEKGIENYIKNQIDAQREPSSLDVRDISSDTDHIRGNPDAKISLIEYSDFECPFCKKFHPTAQQVIDEFDGDVNWVYRHFPLSFHDPLATQEALASECANEFGGNDMFWEYTDLIFERTNSNGRGLKFDDLITMAGELGLNKDDFRDCVESEKYLDRIKNDIEEGKAAGVTGTPGNILLNNETNDTITISGAQPFYKFKTAIEQMLQ